MISVDDDVVASLVVEPEVVRRRFPRRLDFGRILTKVPGLWILSNLRPLILGQMPTEELQRICVRQVAALQSYAPLDVKVDRGSEGPGNSNIR